MQSHRPTINQRALSRHVSLAVACDRYIPDDQLRRKIPQPRRPGNDGCDGHDLRYGRVSLPRSCPDRHRIVLGRNQSAPNLLIQTPTMTCSVCPRADPTESPRASHRHANGTPVALYTVVPASPLTRSILGSVPPSSRWLGGFGATTSQINPSAALGRFNPRSLS
jgi:hypothetical protein